MPSSRHTSFSRRSRWQFWGTLRAFLRRDGLEELSYPFVSLNALVGLMVQLTVLYFAARLVGGHAGGLDASGGPNGPVGADAATALDGGNYFAFAVIGLASFNVLFTCLRGFSQRIRHFQLTGQLEACVALGIPLGRLLWCSSAFLVLKSVVLAGVYIVAAMIMGADLTLSHIGLVALVFCLGLLTFIPLGVTSAALTLVLRRGEPFGYAVTGMCLLFGGVLYPVSLLPDALAAAGQATPIWAFLAVLRSLMLGQGLDDAASVAGQVAILASYATVGLVVAIVVTRWATRQVLQRGTLGHY